MTELARVTLIRLLDETLSRRSTCSGGPVGHRKLWTRHRCVRSPGSFEEVGDRFQALRAQRLLAALQDTAWARVLARLTQARLERELGLLPQAVATLAALRAVLTDPRDTSLRLWHGVNLGRFIAEEHCTLTRALADADLPDEARALFGRLLRRPGRALGERRDGRTGARRGHGGAGARPRLTDDGGAPSAEHQCRSAVRQEAVGPAFQVVWNSR